MLNSFCRALSTAILLTASQASFATIITETWTSTVIDHRNSALIDGATYTWSITFDDAGTRIHTWADGSNGIAEFGGGDDTVHFIDCTASDGGSDCDYVQPSFPMLSDALSTGIDTFMLAALGSSSPYDLYSINRAARGDYLGTIPYYEEVSDWYDFSVTAGTISNIYFYLGPQSPEFFKVSNILVSQRTQGVPEPTIVALLSIGLFGFRLAQRNPLT